MGVLHSTDSRARLAAILNNFGADGWELVQIVPGPNPESLVGYFKRPLPDQEQSR